MYLPKQFEVSDLGEISRFVTEVGAADLVTVDEIGTPIATLMPCVWRTTDQSYGTLVMHMARGNGQWKSMSLNAKSLAIVHGPQAYISPSNYEAKKTDHRVVPTWNYQSVHFTGKVEVSEDVELLRKIVTELTDAHESSREVPWKVAESAPNYFEAQLKGIVAVILHIERVEAKYKLSQNRSIEDQKNVISDLENSFKNNDQDVANEMKRNI